MRNFLKFMRIWLMVMLVVFTAVSCISGIFIGLTYLIETYGGWVGIAFIFLLMTGIVSYGIYED